MHRKTINLSLSQRGDQTTCITKPSCGAVSAWRSWGREPERLSDFLHAFSWGGSIEILVGVENVCQVHVMLGVLDAEMVARPFIAAAIQCSVHS